LCQRFPELVPRSSFSQERFGPFRFSSCSVAGDLTFHEGAIRASDAGGFPCAKNIGTTRRLPLVDADKALLELASQGERQFHVGDQAEAAGKLIAVDGPGALAIRECDTSNSVCAFGVNWPGPKFKPHTPQSEPELQSLPQLRRGPEKTHAEARDFAPVRLLDNCHDVGPMLHQALGHRE
jgi:hypothetical protein